MSQYIYLTASLHDYGLLVVKMLNKSTCSWSNSFLSSSQLECCTSILKTAPRLCWMETQPQACTLFMCVEMRVNPCRSTAIWPLMEAAGLWVIIPPNYMQDRKISCYYFNGIVRSKMKTFTHPYIIPNAPMKVMQGLEWHKGKQMMIEFEFSSELFL